MKGSESRAAGESGRVRAGDNLLKAHPQHMQRCPHSTVQQQSTLSYDSAPQLSSLDALCQAGAQAQLQGGRRRGRQAARQPRRWAGAVETPARVLLRWRCRSICRQQQVCACACAATCRGRNERMRFLNEMQAACLEVVHGDIVQHRVGAGQVDVLKDAGREALALQ